MTTNNCNSLLDYFNGALDETERAQFEEHLNSCSSCQEELNELTLLTEDLPYLSEPINPSVGMKDRILANVFSEEADISTSDPVSFEKEATITPFVRKEKRNKKAGWSTIALAAALLLSLIGNIYSFSTTNQATEVSDRLVKDVQLEATNNNSLAGIASLIEKNGNLNVVVKADGLSEVEGDQVYQVWLLQDGKPYRAGSFVPNQEGSGMATYPMGDLSDLKWDTVAITLEPNTKSETPLGEVLLAAGL